MHLLISKSNKVKTPSDTLTGRGGKEGFTLEFFRFLNSST